jgi:hypothetical protein
MKRKRLPNAAKFIEFFDDRHRYYHRPIEPKAQTPSIEDVLAETETEGLDIVPTLVTEIIPGIQIL